MPMTMEAATRPRGATQERKTFSCQKRPCPADEAQTAMGGLGGLSLEFLVSQSTTLSLNLDSRYRKTKFKGASLVDETITEASLRAFEHQLSAGVAFQL